MQEKQLKKKYKTEKTNNEIYVYRTTELNAIY